MKQSSTYVMYGPFLIILHEVRSYTS